MEMESNQQTLVTRTLGGIETLAQRSCQMLFLGDDRLCVERPGRYHICREIKIQVIGSLALGLQLDDQAGVLSCKCCKRIKGAIVVTPEQ
ncbi:hypothetical protein SDC9_63031 [bioreactor metagenome]|uniref:Uncharacterized protein n=1 Tax=bioreactor metagenome TaxID=1076179 RepID=A0A644XKD3_9ZZZZ